MDSIDDIKWFYPLELTRGNYQYLNIYFILYPKSYRIKILS